jgi:hypothetical protein
MAATPVARVRLFGIGLPLALARPALAQEPETVNRRVAIPTISSQHFS